METRNINITRDEAIEALLHVADSNILNEELKDKLINIISCIGAEKEGRHEWGQNTKPLYDFADNETTDEAIKACINIIDNVTFIPASCEREEITEALSSLLTEGN